MMNLEYHECGQSKGHGPWIPVALTRTKGSARLLKVGKPYTLVIHETRIQDLMHCLTRSFPLHLHSTCDLGCADFLLI
jgi:hypothetical protein